MAGKVGGKRTLVLVDAMKVGNTHSMLFDTLKDRGHEVTVELADDPELRLTAYGDMMYDNVIMMAPRWEESGSLTRDHLMDYVDRGVNLVVMADIKVSEAIRSLAAMSGIDYDTSGSQVVDHFQYEDNLGGSEPHTVIHATGLLENTRVLGPDVKNMAPVLYRGIGHAVDDDNILAVKVLTGGPSAYSAVLDQEIETYPENVGKDTLLVTAMQARNNARLTFTGSMHVCSNRYFLATLADTNAPSGNREFCTHLTKWALGEAGILRASNITHHREDGSDPELLLKEKERPDLPASLFADPEITRNSLVYRIKDYLTYSFVMEEFTGEEWVPYQADDVQLEFVMLDPYIRKTMDSDETGLFTTTFQVPDVYGIFKFRLMYRRVGLSTISFDTQVSVRPFKHNEYERFIQAAFPYYTSSFTIMAGFFIFSFFFLYSK
eukprot:CAMPEP_0117754286 /NCGR_PEP_ID=MMETSP0947-20121206/12742_1 /TAXON_ID=44440 /ORGANISM="Chattonella subsalsa, Strain CCMP2191" /LENGTH=434 /DNA_ID=CAMNT_0005573353 /DNA_START=212 /DNA_END=1516 /DNA_ORIENTATION=-